MLLQKREPSRRRRTTTSASHDKYSTDSFFIFKFSLIRISQSSNFKIPKKKKKKHSKVFVMDPCPFVRLTIDSLALRLPETATNKQIGGEVHPSSTPCYCKLRIKHFPSQKALLPLSSFSDASSPPESSTSAPGFHLDADAIRRISGKKISLRVSVYAGRTGHTCGVASGKLLGKVEVAVDLAAALSRTVAFHNGWKKLGGDGDKPSARLHLLVCAEPDPRFVFQFGGEPECSPVVYQIQDNLKQPVFSCKFSSDRNGRSR